jgi:Ca2+-binding RTX toxin-like protein
VAIIIGDALKNNLDGTIHADRIYGLGDRDLLMGEAGNDYLKGGAGDDYMYGGTGNDTYVVDSLHDIVGELSNEGTDLVISSVNFALDGLGHTAIENLTLTGNAIIGVGNELNNVIRGTNSHNALLGFGGNDTLAGLGGNDGIDGDDGNDFLNGGAGADTMRGGKGNDSMVVDNNGDVVVEAANQGTDRVVSSINFSLSLAGRANIENLTLTGSAAIIGSGNALNNHISGNSIANVLLGVGGNDAIAGGNGADNINGGAGNDALNGGTGKDALIGGTGNDTINGGPDADTISTGSGSDRIVFNSGFGAPNIDKIFDFSPAADTILLETAIFAGVGIGVLAAGAFHIGPSAADADDRIIYNDQTGRLYFDSDGVGGAGQSMFCTLQTGLALTNADFIGI